jgi:hypothetical protein
MSRPTIALHSRAAALFGFTLVLMLTSALARADGLDVGFFFWKTGFPENTSIAAKIGVILLMVVLDYVWNAGVIGLAASRLGKQPLRKILKDLVPLTILGQVADRVGAGAALLIGFLAPGLVPVTVFVAPGVAIAALVFLFGKKSWNLANKQALGLGLVAGVATNPAIGNLLWGLTLMKLVFGLSLFHGSP